MIVIVTNFMFVELIDMFRKIAYMPKVYTCGCIYERTGCQG